MPHQLEARMVEQVLDVALGAGEEVVDAQDVMALLDEPVAQVAAQETGAAGHEHLLGGVVLAHAAKSLRKKNQLGCCGSWVVRCSYIFASTSMRNHNA